MKFFYRVVIGVAALAVAVLILVPEPAVRPTAATSVLTASARIAGPAAATESTYLERLLRDPGDIEARVDLAQFYLSRARETADEVRFVPMARTHLEEALRVAPDDYRSRLLDGTLQNKLHRFEEGERIARELIAEHPEHAYNYGTLVDALVELGRYDEAVTTMDAMLALRPDLSSYARASYIRELMGDGQGAVRAMERAAQAGAIGSEGRSWALHQLGMMALGDGRLADAEHLLRGLLEESPGNARAIAGLAHIRLVEGRLQEARQFVEEAMALAPGAGFEETAAEVYLAMGDADAGERALRAIEAGLHEADRMGENVQMEKADFQADQDRDLEDALWLASLELARRPDHLHANETYAWVLFKLDRAEQAIPYIDHARRFDNGDAKATFRAGQIYLAAGRDSEGFGLLGQSLEEGLHTESPSAAREARAILGNR